MLSHGLSFSCRRQRSLCFFKKESESSESYLDGRGDRRRCFFVSYTGRRDDDRVKIQQSTARVLSPFFTMVIRDEWPVLADYAIVIHSIHSMLKNNKNDRRSIHSVQKLMNGPTERKFTKEIFVLECSWPLKYHGLTETTSGSEGARNPGASGFFSCRNKIALCLRILYKTSF